MPYKPQNTQLKDCWFFRNGSTVQAAFMQLDNLENPVDTRKFCTVGQSRTTDLITWEALPEALHSDPAPSCDDRRLHTGSVIEHDGLFYMFYTATHTAPEGSPFTRGRACLALATSKDGINWEKHPANPIISPDPRYYYHNEGIIPLHCHGWPILDCRDLHVVKDPDGNGWWGYYAARSPSKTCAGSSVIALCHSHDLIHWEHHAPCFVSDRHACVEVPDVFCIDGKWVMLLLTGNGYGQRFTMAERAALAGTIYAVADHPSGPFREVDHNVLIACTLPGTGGFCHRTLADGEQWLAFNTIHGGIGLPHRLAWTPDGRLRLYYHPALDAYRDIALLQTGQAPQLSHEGEWGSIGDFAQHGETTAAHCPDDWALAVFDAPVVPHFIFETTLQLTSARSAGLAFALQGDDILGGGHAILLDAEAGTVIHTTLRSFQTLNERVHPLQRDRGYRLRCVVIGTVTSVYIDDILILQTHHKDLQPGRLALFIERGQATFSASSAQALRMGNPA